MMNILLNARELKERASLVLVLAKLGFQPANRSGSQYFYRSMLRDDDRKAAFMVDDNIGAWYDQGMGKGGNVIDFALKFWPQLDFHDVVRELNYLVTEGTVADLVPAPRSGRKRRAVRIPNYLVSDIKPLGTHPAISDYLKDRAVFQAAKSSVSEVYYYVEDNQGRRKNYFAAGWQNENGSWEVRNRFFKGCLGIKGISFLKAKSKKVSVFEGYMNYLSWKTAQEEPCNIIVLNYLSLLAAGIAIAKGFSEIDLYFDRDSGGHEATRTFTAALPYAVDRSSAYTGFNDYNDKLKAVSRQERLADTRIATMPATSRS